jgi:hypothetical protein
MPSAMKLRRLRRRGYEPRTLGGDKGYDAGRFPHDVLGLGIEPHITVNEHASCRSPARRFVRRRGYSVSQRLRKRIEEIFGWAKSGLPHGGGQPIRAAARPGHRVLGSRQE